MVLDDDEGRAPERTKPFFIVVDYDWLF